VTPKAEENLTYETITVFWEVYQWQPFKAYTFYASPNGKYRALINDKLKEIAYIITRNKIIYVNKKSTLRLFALLNQVGNK